MYIVESYNILELPSRWGKENIMKTRHLRGSSPIDGTTEKSNSSEAPQEGPAHPGVRLLLWFLNP